MNPLGLIPGSFSKGMIQAQEYFDAEHLELPFIHSSEKPKIKTIQASIFGSKNDPMNPYDLEAYIKETVSAPVEDYVIFGFAGHGVNSRGMHYYAVKGNLALFIQLAYGGVAIRDENEARNRINAIFHLIPMFFEAIEEANKNELIQKDRRLLVVESDFYGKGWGWIDGYPGKIDEKEWHTEDPTLISALNDIPRS